MKKVGLLFLGGIAALMLFANLGPMVVLAFSLVILYFSFKGFMKTDSVFKKIAWSILGIIGLSASISNLPAILGLAAAYVLYQVWKNWKKEEGPVKESKDPFTNFEKQWAQLKNN